MEFLIDSEGIVGFMFYICVTENTLDILFDSGGKKKARRIKPRIMERWKCWFVSRQCVDRERVCRSYYLARGSMEWTETKGPPSKIMPTFRNQELTEKRDPDVIVYESAGDPYEIVQTFYRRLRLYWKASSRVRAKWGVREGGVREEWKQWGK